MTTTTTKTTNLQHLDILKAAASRVQSQLGSYQHEKVYQVALSFELADQGIINQMEVVCPIWYQTSVRQQKWLVGEGYIDMVIPSWETVIEIKHADKVSDADIGQLRRYLSLSHAFGFLICFSKKNSPTEPIVLPVCLSDCLSDCNE